ncbi:hypothetical protein HHE014_00660 [Helicobacter heilmannii]|nr:hypothetical protein HHE014_00660 [Helicobacter heilmannii]
MRARPTPTPPCPLACLAFYGRFKSLCKQGVNSPFPTLALRFTGV